ncbi:unnamed protein product, partial [Scytosiphon promiscuus]
QAEDAWDDRAILKAFDDALNSHTRKPVNGVEARKWDKHAAKAAVDQSLSSANRMVPPPQFSSTATPRGVANRSTPAAGQVAAASPGHPNAGGNAADRRFTSLLAKGNAEALSGGAATVSARGVRAGIPGPWEPVAGSSEGRPPPPPQQQQQPSGIRYPRCVGRYSPAAHGGLRLAIIQPRSRAYAFSCKPCRNQDGGLGRNGLPPPPAPPHPGVGPHAAAFQVTPPDVAL